MRKTALLKTSFREINQSKTRFLSIMGIIFLGVMVFVGLKATGPDMIQTASTYYQKQKLPDARIVSTLGLTAKDIDGIKQVKAVETVYPRYTKDLAVSERNVAVKFVSYDLKEKPPLNDYLVIEGRMPEKSGEIVLDNLAQMKRHYKLGETLRLSKEDNKDKSLKSEQFKIVGFVQSPEYIENISRGNTTIGKGSLDFFAVVPKEDLTLSAYTEILVSFKGLSTINSYSSEYKDKRDEAVVSVKQAIKQRPKQRVEEIQEASKASLEKTQKDISDGENTLIATEKKLQASEQELALGKQVLAQSQLAAGQQQLEQSTIGDQAKLNEIRAKIEEGQMAYDQKLAEFQKKKAEILPKLKDAKQQVEKKQKEIADLKVADYYYFTRDDNPGNLEYEDNANRISSLATVFPMFFFFIAALVSLTTMTRMVEEKRMEIGSLKALGYRNSEIAFKFLVYAAIASICGAVLGLVVGYYLFPTIIFDAYGQLYTIPDFVTLWYFKYSFIGMFVAILCTAGAALVVLRIDLFSTPASLLRPKAPKAGQRILLERVKPIWNRLSFIQKVTARNLFRYKQRMLMTVFGIAGCMALIITGFGLKDSISDVVEVQFNKIWHYQAIVTFKDDVTEKESQNYQAAVDKVDGLKKTMPIYVESLKTVNDSNANQDVPIYVPEIPKEMDDFILFNDRQSGEKYQLSEDGVIINEKLANLFNYKTGDTLVLKNSDNQTYKLKIKAISENYTRHFAYMSPNYYERIFKKEPQYNTEFLLFDQAPSEKAEGSIGKELMENQKVLTISFLSAASNVLDDTIHSLNIVVWVLITVSGLLAFIVLYNLTNINVSERIRELSTIKVLGFYDKEVTMYVYRENIILTFIGIFFGCLFGKLVHGYVLTTVEVDMLMFSPTIHWISYFYSALITLFFTLLVMVFMHNKLKKIDMIEALKSNE